MANESDKTSGPAEVQVFELTMDNDEDQNELNRRLRKPGEPERCAAVKPEMSANSPLAGAQDQSTAQPSSVEPS